MNYEAVFFDLDGTVIDTLQNITDAVNHTLRCFGLPEVTAQELKPRLGWGAAYLLGSLNPQLSPERQAELLACYLPYYARHTTENTPPYPGILPLLQRLHARGTALAVVSNKPDAAVQPLMDLHFRGLLSYAAGEKPGIARKPAPDMLRLAADALGVRLPRCLYVGDTEVDLQTAQNTGIDCVCVAWGFRTREQLLRAGADRIADTPEDLLRFLS